MTFFDFCFELNFCKSTQSKNIIIQIKSFEVKVSFARNLKKQERIRMKISNPFVFQQLTSSVVEGLEEEIS